MTGAIAELSERGLSAAAILRKLAGSMPRVQVRFIESSRRCEWRSMTITISNLTVATSAPAETVVGVLTATDARVVVPCDFILSKKASGYFAVAANNVVAAWSAPPAPGYYPLRVRAVGIDTWFADSATFVVNVIALPPGPQIVLRRRR
jgi:hypothetical protein